MKPTPVRSGFFSWKNYQLAYEVWGDVGVPCLLMHGILMDSEMNRGLARRFVSQGYKVVLLDLLGHGNSDKPTDPREHRTDFYAQQGLACLDHLGIDKALIGGVSLGANTTLQLATTAPERCLGMFLEMPVMEWSSAFAGMIFLPLLTAVNYFQGSYRLFARFLRWLPTPSSEVVASLKNGFSAEPEVITAILHGTIVGPVVPASELRRQLTMPAVIIGHEWDRIHQMRDAVALARELPDARFLKAKLPGIDLRSPHSALWPEISQFLQHVRSNQPATQKRSTAKARKRIT
jgi:pimeloyl-ACP methyl ester carboxylesterase